MQTTRPIFLNLFAIRFPITAIVSILHRISGIVIFLALPFLIYALQTSLSSESGFMDLQQQLSTPWLKLALLLVLFAISYHFFAGIRHILMDMGYGHSLKGGRFGAYLVLILAIASFIGLGVWLW